MRVLQLVLGHALGSVLAEDIGGLGAETTEHSKFHQRSTAFMRLVKLILVVLRVVLIRLIITKCVNRFLIPFADDVLSDHWGDLEGHFDVLLADLLRFLLQCQLVLLPLPPVDVELDLLVPGFEARFVEHAGEEKIDRGGLDLRHEHVFFLLLGQLLLLLALEGELCDAILRDQLLDGHRAIELQVDVGDVLRSHHPVEHLVEVDEAVVGLGDFLRLRLDVLHDIVVSFVLIVLIWPIVDLDIHLEYNFVDLVELCLILDPELVLHAIW